MSVAPDAVMVGGNSSDGDCQQVSGATSISSTGITLGASATIIVAFMAFQSSVTAITMTWNGVAMTAGPTFTTLANTVAIFYLVNPATGNHTLAAAWTGSSDCYMGAQSFTGSDTITGIASGDSVTGNGSGAASLAVASDANGATAAAYCANGSGPTTNFTQIYQNDPLNPCGGASYQLGGATNTHTFTAGGSPSTQVACGIHIIASTGAAAYEQEGYRWRDDDGSESAANWLAAQDADITRGKDITTRLRTVVDTITGDPPSGGLKLQYRKVGDAGWRDVPPP